MSNKTSNRIKITITVLPDTYTKLKSLSDISGRTLGDTVDKLINNCEEIFMSRSGRSVPLRVILEKYRDAFIRRLLNDEDVSSICVSEGISSIECYFIDYFIKDLLVRIGELIIRGRIKPRDLINLRKPKQ